MSSQSPTAVGKWRDYAHRVTLVFLGLLSLSLGVIALANPALSLNGLLELVVIALGLNLARTLVAEGGIFHWTRETLALPTWGRRLYRQLGSFGIGLLATGLALAAFLDPLLTTRAAIFLLTIALVFQGIGRMIEDSRTVGPSWLQRSSFATGVVIVVLVVLSLTFEGVAILAFVVLVGVILIVTGIQTIVEGLGPTDPRQYVLLRLILFSAFYGLVLINWIDLFGKQVPAYGVWLVLTYFAPFGVLLVFEGWRAWPLAIGLGLFVSLMNDVGYFLVGNLLFGFHVALAPWIAGQLGLEGNTIVTVFYGGRFAISVTSWMMGLSIYLRAVVVAMILYYWWRHPTELVARISHETPTPSA
jgi:uncharacterized membrane protein HdeD (DUF308 family)